MPNVCDNIPERVGQSRRIFLEYKSYGNADSVLAVTKNQGLALDDQILKRREMFEKWALQWKSVILSGLGQTLYPYGLYIRVLDLNNFADLLQEPSFRERSMNNFFAGDMAQYLKTRDTPMKRGKKKGAKAAYSSK